MKSWMNRVLRILSLVVGVLVILLVGVVVYVNASWDSPDQRPVPSMTAPHDSVTLAHGEFLFKFTTTCWGCHSNVNDANSSPFGGRPFNLREVGPGFGMFYTPNITPDVETGIGGWTDGELVRAIREGVGKNGRKLFPLMPMATLHGLSDDDVLAIVAYIRSIPPVHNKVPPHDLTFATKALFTFGLVKPEVPVTGPVTAPPKGVTAEYGRYLANHQALCADCHTPRNLSDGSFYFDSLFAGSSISFGDAGQASFEAFAPNLTPDRETGIGGWTEEQFLLAVQVGMTPDKRVLSPEMPYHAYVKWDEDNLRAVFLYLKGIPAIKRKVPQPMFAQELTTKHGVERGEMIFRANCEVCHGKKGKGAAPTNVALADVASSLDDETFMEFVSTGNPGLHMPGFGKTFSQEQLKDVVAYIKSWDQ